jgi:Raf kinase inhibitor-like YbhB/YbcL family protein
LIRFRACFEREIATVKLVSHSFGNGQRIPAEFAFGKPGSGEPMILSDNRNPHLAWDGAPAGTQSFALLCVDSDVPTVFDDANRAGRTIRAELPRQNFIHWVMVDIPATVREIAAASCASGIVKGGKQNPPGPAGSRQGINDYGSFMGDGDYYGYDGPCPPWNDLLLHRYHFRLYALDRPSLGLAGRFTAADAWRAMQGHVLGETSIHGTYSLNPAVKG